MPDLAAQTNFRLFRKTQGPPWLTVGGDSELVGYTLDALKDAFIERIRKGLLVRFPQQDAAGTPGPDDALAALGRDRRIVRGFGETSTAYAARLLGWLDVWKTAGNPFTLMDQLAALLGPLPQFRTVDVRGNWYTRAPGGARSALLNQGNWNWDGASDALRRWSRFWVIVFPNGLWTSGRNWGDPGAWGDPGVTWGTSATADQIGAMRGIVADWKPAGTKCVNIIAAFDSRDFDPTVARNGAGLPDGTWGSPWKQVGGAYVQSRITAYDTTTTKPRFFAGA